ncbi:MAG TPA: arsenate reductase ArsC [Candidatus Sulfotelmatobacter sp.]|jgi:arsenate reductase|nr:arsenate reductase ArsC [Candidatus Sulfotelmatobacter sp.]
MESKVKVLFLCKGDSARGQMAEGFLNTEAGDSFLGVSAATTPTAPNPLAVEVMEEVGIDISGEKSKTIPEIFKEHFAYVVGIYNTAKERPPVFPFTYRVFQWSLEDPASGDGPHEKQASDFRHVRDRINDNVHEFLKIASGDITQHLVPGRAAR